MTHISQEPVTVSSDRRSVTSADRAIIKAYYEQTPKEAFDLTALAKAIGRTRAVTCRIAGTMGLTFQGRPKSTSGLENLRKASLGKWALRPHPRGALGMVHTEKTKAILSEKSRAMWDAAKINGTGPMSDANLQRMSDLTSARMAAVDPSAIYSRGAAGYREDLGDIYFRSRWEANYARYLNWLKTNGAIEDWQYEPETYWFEKIRRGVRSYKPDFKVFERGGFHFDEVKGFMDAKSKTKIKRMAIYFPEVDLRVIDEKAYYAIASTMKRILPLWETEAKGRMVVNHA